MHPACASRVVREAAAAGQVGEVIRLVRKAHGLSQTRLGAVTDRSQSTISRIERGGSGSRDVDTLRCIGSALDIPAVMLGLAEQPKTKRYSGLPVKRRELLFGAATMALTNASLPGTIIAEDEAAAAVHAITTTHRRLDGTTPSGELVEPVLAHLRMATRMQAGIGDPMNSQAMAAAVSEAAGLAGWLHWDLHDLGSARRHYRQAVEQARRAGGDPLLIAYMLGSLASFVVQEGEPGEGLVLIRRAINASEGGESPATADAWLAAMEAVAYASAGNDAETWRALDRAEAAVERVAGQDTPPWPWISPFDARKIASHRLMCAVRLHRPDVAYAAVENFSLAADHHRKQGALVLLDLASAHIQAHEVEEGLCVAIAAVNLAAATRSERVLGRARQFRRIVPVRASHQLLGEFDEHLRAARAREETMG